MSNLVELVFVPAPVVGHLISTVQLAKFILRTNERISISIHIINYHFQSDKINAYVDSQSRDNSYSSRLTFVTLPPLSNPPDLSWPKLFSTVIELHKPLVKQMVEDRVRAGFPRVGGFVLDMFCTTMVDIANEMHVPSYNFFVSGAVLLNFILYTRSLADDHGLEACDIKKKLSDAGFSSIVPGFKNPVTSKVIPAMFEHEEFGCEMMLNFARQLSGMKGILVNSYVELESFAIQALLNGDDKKIPPTYPVGPLLELDNKGRGWSNDEEKESIKQWLDDQPRSSVVFLCFGSMGIFCEEQVKEIADGLERSGHRFLWALRKPPRVVNVGDPDENETFLEALPEGFLDRTTLQGKVIGWAPQVEVLAHPAIGGLVSHCGWNSILESLWFGVPIATWPLYADNQLHAFELVKELELAVEIRMDYKMNLDLGKGNFLVTAPEIEKGVRKLMSMDETMRNKVKVMSDKGRKALDKGGSSRNWLSCFVEHVLSYNAYIS